DRADADASAHALAASPAAPPDGSGRGLAGLRPIRLRLVRARAPGRARPRRSGRGDARRRALDRLAARQPAADPVLLVHGSPGRRRHRRGRIERLFSLGVPQALRDPPAVGQVKILLVSYKNPWYLAVADYVERALRGMGHEVEFASYRDYLLP